jgi:hypothetical protein
MNNDPITAYLVAIKELETARVNSDSDPDRFRAAVRAAWNSYDALSPTEQGGVERPD